MNILLYVLDALRADHLSCYGYERSTSPVIDRLAAEGVRFERCYTPATWTRPVAVSVLTGLYPPAHGTRTRHDTLTTDYPTLAERFTDTGYETVGITAMGNVSTATGFDRGFETFRDLYREEGIIEKRQTSTATEEELQTESGTVALPRAEDITDAFGEWLNGRSGDRPFFAFCWSIEPHIPYDPPEGYERFRDSAYDGPVDGSRESLKQVETAADLNALRDRYDEEIWYNDECIGAMLDRLGEAGELDETLVVVVGDHGDAFEEHGRLTHGHAPHEEVARVPWVVRPPVERGPNDPEVVNSLVGLVDLAPTLVEYATGEDIKRPEPKGVGGRSVADALDGEPVAGHDAVFFETKSYDMQNAFYGVRTDRWKYIEIETPGRDAGTMLDLARYIIKKGILLNILRNPGYYWRRYRYNETSMLYDLANDPSETENLAGDRPDRQTELAETLSSWRVACKRFREAVDASKETTIDERTREQLRELGYAE